MCSLINIFLIAAMVQMGMAIECFNCDSSMNEGCANMTDKNLVAEECTFEKLMNLNRPSYGYHEHLKHWLFTISAIDFHKTNDEYVVPMACQKIIGIDENKLRTTIRRCQLRIFRPCNITLVRAAHQNMEIEHCSLCEENGCNGSSNNQIFSMMIGVLTTITITIHLRF